MNVLTIYEIVRYFWYPALPFSKGFNYGLAFTVAILNYLFVFLSGRYKSFSLKAKTNLFAIIYIIISFIVLLWILTLHHDMNVEMKK